MASTRPTTKLRVLHSCESCGVSGAHKEVNQSHEGWLCRECYLRAQRPQRAETGSKAAQRVSQSNAIREPLESRGGFALTDLGNAERLVALFGDRVRFNPERGLWLIWDGRRWQWDEGNMKIMGLAKRAVRSIYKEAAAEPLDARREALGSHARKSESWQRLLAMTRLSQSEDMVAVTMAELDVNPWLFNCANGTLDLRSGALLGHRKEDLITVMVPITYDPNAKCPIWGKFLERVTGGSVDLQSYLQRCVGYTLTGDIRAQAVFFLWGLGSNGKTTFVVTVRLLLGPYGSRVEMDLLTVRGKNGPRETLADLRGKRFVAASEVEEGRQLAVSLIKDLSGGESIRADRKYEHGFEYQPQCKLWLVGNHRPVITDTTYSIWRRLKLIPFMVTIPPEEVDRELPAKLEGELPGILAWAVKGCLDWQRAGLGEPEIVSRETSGYRREQDLLADFLDDCCVLDPASLVSKVDLKTAYAQWCEGNGAIPLGQRSFKSRLLERGITEGRSRDRKTRIWLGLRLADKSRVALSVADNTGQDLEQNPLRREYQAKLCEKDVQSCPETGNEHETADKMSANNNHHEVEALLGMPIDQAVEVWHNHGSPRLHLGNGQQVADNPDALRKILAAKRSNGTHVDAIAKWLVEVRE